MSEDTSSISPPDIIVFDVETQRLFDEVGGPQYMDRLGLAAAVTYSIRDGRFRHFLEPQADELIDTLMSAAVVVGFNCLHFDYRVLQAYTPFDLAQLPTVDMLRDIERNLGFRVSLDRLAQATLGRKKAGDGLQSVRWYREGKLDQVLGYCQVDVEITRDLFVYGLLHREVWFFDRNGQRTRVPVSWGDGAVGALYHSLSAA